MSDKSSSGFQWLRDSSLQIIAALIGSSLLVTIITTIYSEINQPSISLNVIPHYPNQPADIKKPEIDYYEIIAKNDGKRQATNMSLSAYFNGSISNPTPYFSGEVISEPTVKNVSGPQNTQIKGSLLRWEIPRLAPGAMIIFNVWTTATKYTHTILRPLLTKVVQLIQYLALLILSQVVFQIYWLAGKMHKPFNGY